MHRPTKPDQQAIRRLISVLGSEKEVAERADLSERSIRRALSSQDPSRGQWTDKTRTRISGLLEDLHLPPFASDAADPDDTPPVAASQTRSLSGDPLRMQIDELFRSGREMDAEMAAYGGMEYGDRQTRLMSAGLLLNMTHRRGAPNSHAALRIEQHHSTTKPVDPVESFIIAKSLCNVLVEQNIQRQTVGEAYAALSALRTTGGRRIRLSVAQEGSFLRGYAAYLTSCGRLADASYQLDAARDVAHDSESRFGTAHHRAEQSVLDRRCKSDDAWEMVEKFVREGSRSESRDPQFRRLPGVSRATSLFIHLKWLMRPENADRVDRGFQDELDAFAAQPGLERGPIIIPSSRASTLHLRSPNPRTAQVLRRLIRKPLNLQVEQATVSALKTVMRRLQS